MKGIIMTSEHLELLQRLEAWSPDAPDAAFSFTRRLARDNHWPLRFAERVVREYKRFAFLGVAAGHPVTPSDQVDQAWHLHLLYTHSYWKEFCPEILRAPLHHGPTKGGAGERDKFNDWYGRTLASYRSFFVTEPPADIWPEPKQRFGDDIHFARVNTVRNWVVPKPVWIRETAFVLSAAGRRISGFWKWMMPACPWRLAAAVLIAALFLSGCTGDHDFMTSPGWPFDMTAGPFLMFFLIFWAAAAGWAMWWRRKARLPADAPENLLAELDAYEAALLAGGRNRALFAAVASLTHRGALEIDEKEHRLRSSVLSSKRHPFEMRLHQRVANHPGCTFKENSEASASWAEFESMEEKLGNLGLLTTGRWNICFIPMLIGLTVPLIGFIKIIIGISRDKPVGVLFVLSLVSLGVALAFAVRPHRTRRGDAILKRLKEQHSELENLARTGEASPVLLALPLAVGLFGPSVLNDTPLADMEKKLQCNTGGVAGGGCGGGCGGGGCGGGCGGCGG